MIKATSIGLVLAMPPLLAVGQDVTIASYGASQCSSAIGYNVPISLHIPGGATSPPL